jgi:recombination protein RecA
MSQALRILTPTVSRTKTCLIFINQLREKIGVMFGSPETTPGGRALKFFSSVRLDVRKINNIKEGEHTIGARIKAKVVKNKLAPPFRQTEFDLMHDSGISKEGDLIDLALEDKIIEKSGGHHSYGEMRLGNGRENVKQYLRDNPALCEEIGRKILEVRQLIGNRMTESSASDNGEAEEPAKPDQPPSRGRRAAAAAPSES